MNENLIYCPFCGNGAKIITDKRFDTYDISCTNPMCFAYRCEDEARYYSIEDAVKDWNRRVHDDLFKR
jgi:hypothetical protein